LPKEDLEAQKLVRISVYTSIIITTAISITIIGGAGEILHSFNAESIRPFIWLLPVYILFSSWLFIARQWLIRKNLFKIEAQTTFYKSVILGLSKIGTGCLSPNAIALITLSTVADVIHTLAISYKTKFAGLFFPLRFSVNNIKNHLDIALKYYEFPLYRTPTALINSASQSIPLLLFASCIGATQAGYFSLARTTVAIPIILIGDSMRSVFSSRIAKASHNSENISKLILKATLWLAGISFIPFLFIFILGPLLFSLVFGNQWEIAGHYSRWLALMLFLMLINIPAISSIPVLGIHKWYLIFEFASTAIRICVLYIGIKIFNNDVVAIALYSFAGAISYMILIIKVIRCKHYIVHSETVNLQTL
jgi:O-antigen/teichoic acid export membrane protein